MKWAVMAVAVMALAGCAEPVLHGETIYAWATPDGTTRRHLEEDWVACQRVSGGVAPAVYDATGTAIGPAVYAPAARHFQACMVGAGYALRPVANQTIAKEINWSW